MGNYVKETESDDFKDYTSRFNDSRADYFVSEKGNGNDHCHFYNNFETGESGVIHRGDCNVCDDFGSEILDFFGNLFK